MNSLKAIVERFIERTKQMATVKVEVTEDDVKHGKQLDCLECPVARAVSRLFNRPMHVGLFHVYDERTSQYIGNLSLSAQEFIADFDDVLTKENAKPLSFDLELTIEGEELLSHAQGK